MARPIHKLTALGIKSKKPGHHGDGGGLWLQVSEANTRSWVFRYTRGGKAREMGLGPWPAISLAEARARAEGFRTALAMGRDPMAERDATRAKAQTFKDCAEQVLAQKANELTNAKALAQWRSTLEAYVHGFKLADGRIFGDQVISTLTKQDVANALEPIWTTKRETARRVRMRIEAVFSYARVKDLFSGDNPATNELVVGLLGKVEKQKAHHEALPYRDIHAFVMELRTRPGVAALALEFTILCAARTGETIGATLDEIDLRDKVWRVPSLRMKAKRPHEIPLSARAVEILKQVEATRDADCKFIFSGWTGDAGLSNMALLKTLRDMGRADVTVHGFRSTFRDWAGETTAHPREVIEHALAHQLPDKAEAAYARGTLFDKRRQLMNDWCKYIETAPPVQAAKAA
jgi:integrase